jgi:photosystem II stability/assembly factor-like uncharacterized protein
MSRLALPILALLVVTTSTLAGQAGLDAEALAGLEFRALGPALVSGRISDVAVDPHDRNTWYVGVSSGNVWKTTNRGITFEPVFDDYGSYSIGAVTADPLRPGVVWVGTGENASQRSAGWGDGIYKTTDGGATWRHMGLETSEHIGDILVDPRDSDVVWVASQGGLWSSGGERGLYKTTDGGESWERVLSVSDDTGIADIVFDRDDPDVVYAASYQRRRHVGILIAGGPEGKIFRTRDGGRSWTEIMNGLPPVDLGRIALEVSPHQAGVVYALVAAQGDSSGFYRSTDRGDTWVRRSDYIVVDPQYYGELFADPHRPGRVCAVDVRIHCTEDDGTTFEPLSLEGVHVDHHEIVFDPDDDQHLLVGNDGGLYESWDAGRIWRHFANLPVTQFYRVGLGHEKPFYWAYGGTQDNGTPGGPTRTANAVGIRDGDWTVIVGGDGFQARVHPLDTDVVYGMSQGARIQRVDMRTGVSTAIQPPQVDEAGDTLRWHWDIPFVTSHADPDRVYALGSRLARSDDRGDHWTLIGPDLSRGIDRDTLPVMGRVWPPDAVWKNVFTNEYGIGVAFSESPFDPDLLYAGTDDGLIQVSEDGGSTWRREDAFPGIPTLIYVSEVLASRHDPDRVYALFNNHKRGDFTPYVLRSDDRGRSWTSVAGDLPERHVAWSLVEDPEREDLLFLGTEFGLFATFDGGGRWVELGGGLPTIPVRDIEIQEEEGDLVLATFGRGMYVLDDYTPLRGVTAARLAEQAILFPVRRAWLYEPIRYVRNGSGVGHWAADNPPFGALVAYWLSEPLPGGARALSLEITDAAGAPVDRIPLANEAGLRRASWNLRRAPPEPAPGEERRRGPGPLVEPGTYTLRLMAGEGGQARELGRQSVVVEPLELTRRGG